MPAREPRTMNIRRILLQLAALQNFEPAKAFSSSTLLKTMAAAGNLPTYQDVADAAVVLDGVAHRTPIERSRTLDEQLGVFCFIKCENLQRMGAFKFRGAYTAVNYYLNSGDKELKGVLTYSSGNHAQAIALSTKNLGIPSTIIMPTDAPTLKLKATQEYGGNVVFYDRYKEKRDDVAQKVKAKLPEGTVFIPPYNHKYVIAGQGTVGKELVEDLQSKSVTLDYVFVCVGGGGLISGISLAVKELSPNTKIIGVEPEAGNDAQQSLEQGQIVHIETPKTIADGAQTQHLGDLTFDIMQRNVSKIITVSDEELVDEMKFFGERMKMVVEPTGCLGLAGLRKLVKSGEVEEGANCGVIISGGNVDLELYCRLISATF